MMPHALLRLALAALALLNADLAAMVERLAADGTGMALRTLFTPGFDRSTLSNIMTDFIRLIRSTRAG